VINCEYIRGKDETLNTLLGKIDCKVINGVATSEFNNKLMKTSLKSYYNSKYGFVKLEYNNINGTKLVIELIEVKKIQEKKFSKAKIICVYYQNCCLEYFNETLSLREDATFKYEYSDKSHKELHEGKWKTLKDTLILFDYITNPSLYRTLDGEEALDTTLKDSIFISFLNPKNKESILTKIYINGRCLKYWPNEGAVYRIPKQNIKSISAKDGIYYVKNEKANYFVIYYEPNPASTIESRVTNIAKCIIMNDGIIRLDCEDSLDQSYKLKKK